MELLRQYFVAKDENGVPHGLPEPVVLKRTARLHALAEMMARSSEMLMVAFVATVSAAPEWDAKEPLNK